MKKNGKQKTKKKITHCLPTKKFNCSHGWAKKFIVHRVFFNARPHKR